MSASPTLWFWLVTFALHAGCRAGGPEPVDDFLELGDSRIHYRAEGTGPVVLLAHGGYLDLSIWDPQARYLRDRYRVVRFSDHGHGRTVSGLADPPPARAIIDALTGATAAEPVMLVGHSWGAMLCVDYALAYPERVRQLVLLAPGLQGWTYFQDSTAARLDAARRAAWAAGDTAAVARLFHQTWVVGPRREARALDSAFVASSLGLIEANMRRHGGADWSVLAELPAIDRLDGLAVPTVILVGEYDAEDIHLVAAEYARRSPRVSVRQLEGLAHLLAREDSTRVNRILGAVLDLDRGR